MHCHDPTQHQGWWYPYLDSSIRQHCNQLTNGFVGYQTSSQAAGLNLPQTRWLAGYNVDVWKSPNMGTTNLGAEWDHDNAFKVSNGGSGNVTNLVSLRITTKFG